MSLESCDQGAFLIRFPEALQNLPLTSHKIKLNHAILMMILPCLHLPWGMRNCHTRHQRGTGCGIVRLDTLKGVSVGWCGGLNVCHWCSDCHGLMKEDAVDGEKLRAVFLINPTKSTPLPILNRGEVGPKTQGRPPVSGSTGNRYFFNLLQSNFPASHLALNCLNQT